MFNTVVSKERPWCGFIAFLKKILATGLVSLSAAKLSSVCLEKLNVDGLYEVLQDYLQQQPEVSVTSKQKEELRKLVEAVDFESMQLLALNGSVPARDVNELLEAVHPDQYDELIFECGGAAALGQDLKLKHVKALEFTRQLLCSGIVDWMTASCAHQRFATCYSDDYAALFREYFEQLPRLSHADLMKAFKCALQAENSDTLRRKVEDGVLPLNDLNEMLVGVCHRPEKFLDDIQNMEWAAAVARRLEQESAHTSKTVI